MRKHFPTTAALLLIASVACAQTALDPPGSKKNPATTPTPKGQPFAPSSTTLSQPDRLRPANLGPGPMTGNPLERGPIPNAKTISGTTLRYVPAGLLFRMGDETVMIKGLPDNFLVKDGTTLKIRVHPVKKLIQYKTLRGATATVDCYTAVEIPKAP